MAGLLAQTMPRTHAVVVAVTLDCARHRPKSCKYGYFQIDTWPDSTSSPLMFEGMDLKCGVVNQTTHKRTHPHVHHILR